MKLQWNIMKRWDPCYCIGRVTLHNGKKSMEASFFFFHFSPHQKEKHSANPYLWKSVFLEEETRASHKQALQGVL